MTLNFFKNGKWEMQETFDGTISAAKKLAMHYKNNSDYTVNVESNGGLVLFVAKQ